jgi:hypothetical protein
MRLLLSAIICINTPAAAQMTLAQRAAEYAPKTDTPLPLTDRLATAGIDMSDAAFDRSVLTLCGPSNVECNSLHKRERARLVPADGSYEYLGVVDALKRNTYDGITNWYAAGREFVLDTSPMSNRAGRNRSRTTTVECRSYSARDISRVTCTSN